MRIAVLFAIVGLAVAEYGFQPKKQYTYEYRVKLVTAIPGIKNQGSGLAFYAQFVIQVDSSDRYVCQLKNPTVGEYVNTEVPLPWTTVQEPSMSPVSKYSKEIQQPFVVHMSHGKVQSMDMSEDEPEWVISIKKGVVAQIQMNLRQQSSLSDAIANRLTGQGSQIERYYRVMEDGIAGDCETIYEIIPVPSHEKAEKLQKLKAPQMVAPNAELFKVVKTRNFENCRTSPVFQHMSPPSKSCRPGWKDCHGQASNRSAVASYLLSGRPADFRIHLCENNATTLVFPFGQQTEHLWSYTQQSLNLQQYQSIREPLAPPSNKKSVSSLIFEYPAMEQQPHTSSQPYPLPHPDLTSAPEFNYVLPGAPVKEMRQAVPFSAVRSQVTQILQSLNQAFKSLPDPDVYDVPSRILALVRAVSMLSYDEIGQCYQDCEGQGEEKETMRQLFLDVLAMAGTNPAVSAIKQQIAKGGLTAEQISSLLSVLPMHIKTPTKELIESIYQIQSIPQVAKDQQTRISSALAFGNILHEACVEPSQKEQMFPVKIYNEFCSQHDSDVNGKYLDFFFSAADRTADQFEKAAYLQAVGNVGAESVVERLAPYYYGQKTQNEVVRTQAVYSLHRVLETKPHDVIKAMSPIFFNHSEPDRVRAAAVSVMFACNPALPYMQRIAQSTREEPSEQIVSYIYTTLNTLANVTSTYNPCLFDMSRKARMVLPTAKTPQYGFSYSHNVFYSELIESWQRGTTVQASWFGHQESSIPSSSYVSLTSYLNGFIYTPIRAAMEVDAPQTLLDKIMAPLKSKQQRLSPRDQQNIEQERISTKLGIEADTQTGQAPRAKIYVQLLGAIDRMFSVDNVTLSWLAKQLSTQQTYTNLQKVISLSDMTTTYPSEFGLAVTYTQSTPLVSSLKGQVTIDSQSWQHSQLTFKDVKPFVYGKMLSTVGFVNPFDLRFMAAGADNHLLASFVFDGTAAYDVPSRTCSASVTIKPTGPQGILAHLDTVPFTTAKSLTEFSPITESKDTQIIHFRTADRNVYKFGQEYFGMDIEAYELSERTFNDVASYYEMFKKSPYPTYLDSWLMMSSLRRRQYRIFLDSSSSRSSQSTTFHFKFALDKTGQQTAQRLVGTQDQQLQQAREKSVQKLQQATTEVKSGQGYALTFVSGIEGKIKRTYTVSGVYVTDPDNVHVKSDVEYSCESCSEDYRKMCLKVDVQYPGVALSEDRSRILASDLTCPAKVQLNWGKDCQSARSITVDGYFKKSSASVQAARTSAAAKKCQQDEWKGAKLTPACVQAKLQASMYDKAHFQAKWSNLTPYFMNMTAQVDDLVKYFFFPYWSNDYMNVHNPASQVTVESEFNAEKNSVDFLVKKPTENTWYHQIRVSAFNVSSAWPFTARKSLRSIVKSTVFGQHSDECVLEADDVTTFDNVKIPAELSDCYYLLAKDCSKTSKIAILAKKQHQHKLAVKILLDNEKIELEPSYSDDLQVKVNGGYIQVQKPQSGIHSSEASFIKSADGQVKAEIRRKDRYSVEVKMSQHSAKVTSDGSSVQVKMSPLFYRNKVCGLCGDMNGERTLEMKDAKRCIKKSPQSFVESYVIADSSCQPRSSTSQPEACQKVSRRS